MLNKENTLHQFESVVTPQHYMLQLRAVKTSLQARRKVKIDQSTSSTNANLTKPMEK